MATWYLAWLTPAVGQCREKGGEEDIVLLLMITFKKGGQAVSIIIRTAWCNFPKLIKSKDQLLKQLQTIKIKVSNQN